MTTLIETIKANQLTSRKEKDGLKTALLTTLIGEVDMVGKNANRQVTDDEVVAVIKKFIKNIDISIAALGDVSNEKNNADRYVNLLKEQSILNHYLPQQLDAQRLTSIIGGIAMTVGNNTGLIMKELKATYTGQYDGKLASDIVKGLLV